MMEWLMRCWVPAGGNGSDRHKTIDPNTPGLVVQNQLETEFPDECRQQHRVYSPLSRCGKMLGQADWQRHIFDSNASLTLHICNLGMRCTMWIVLKCN